MEGCMPQPVFDALADYRRYQPEEHRIEGLLAGEGQQAVRQGCRAVGSTFSKTQTLATCLRQDRLIAQHVALRANDDETVTPRKFTLEGV